MRFVELIIQRGTYAAMFYKKKLKTYNSYFIQFSLMDKWKYPHKEYRFNNGSWLCGWAYFTLEI